MKGSCNNTCPFIIDFNHIILSGLSQDGYTRSQNVLAFYIINYLLYI